MTPTIDFENARQIIGRRSTFERDGFAVTGTVTAQHLHQTFGTEHLHRMNIGYSQIFAATDRYDQKPLLGMTEAQGKVKLIDRPTYAWQLSGGNGEVARITKVKCTDLKPGINHQKFEIAVDKPWFAVSDIISPQNNDYRFRVVPDSGTVSRQVRREGPSTYIYTVELITAIPSRFCPPAYLQVNAEWRKVSSAVATEDQIDGGGFQFYSIFEAQGQTQQHAVKFSISDKALRRIKAAKTGYQTMDAECKQWTRLFFVKDLRKGKNEVQGKQLNDFMSVMEGERLNRLHADVENTLMFGQISDNMESPEGHQIHTASGLREQLESGTTLTHNGNMSLEQLEDWFDSVMKDKISTGDQKIVLSAGREFRKMFNRMITADSKTFQTLDTIYIQADPTYRHMKYGAYFSEYRGFSVTISVMENPAYDNQMFCPAMHPVRTDVPIDSWRADILDFGSTKEQGTGLSGDNICMVSERFCDYNIRTEGKWRGGFDGETGLPITDGGLGMAGQISGYSYLSEKNAGLMIADVTRCGTIRMEPVLPN